MKTYKEILSDISQNRISRWKAEDGSGEFVVVECKIGFCITFFDNDNHATSSCVTKEQLKKEIKRYGK